MSRTNSYLFKSFLITFGPIFVTLFAIMSLVFFIQISRITSYIEVSFAELGMLYLFLLPKMMIFVVPISFFVGVGLCFHRLSRDNESTVMFALGRSSWQMARFFMLLSLAVSAVLLLIGLAIMPAAEHLSRQFIEDKKSKLSLNIRPSELGQKFDNWMVFVESQHGKGIGAKYENIVLYDAATERLILSGGGEVRSVRNESEANIAGWELALNGGYIYDSKRPSWNVAKYGDMVIRAKIDSEVLNDFSLAQYWAQARIKPNRARDLTIYSLVALFVLAGTLWAMSFGIVTYRYQKGGVYIGMMSVMMGYFAAIMILAQIPFIAIPTIFSATLLGGVFVFNNRIAKKY